MVRVLVMAIAMVCASNAMGKAQSTHWVVHKSVHKCEQCVKYNRCLKVLKGAHRAECLRIMAAHRVVCPNVKSVKRNGGK